LRTARHAVRGRGRRSDAGTKLFETATPSGARIVTRDPSGAVRVDRATDAAARRPPPGGVRRRISALVFLAPASEPPCRLFRRESRLEIGG